MDAFERYRQHLQRRVITNEQSPGSNELPPPAVQQARFLRWRQELGTVPWHEVGSTRHAVAASVPAKAQAAPPTLPDGIEAFALEHTMGVLQRSRGHATIGPDPDDGRLDTGQPDIALLQRLRELGPIRAPPLPPPLAAPFVTPSRPTPVAAPP